ncbi:hypothetical protein QVD17_00101 [Tagetes erecta]|uniref:Uncharacterized protein n=1 Tax=Tagetes erecta TaxID=13708 RepID=A0AAD8L3Z5_TARER|nr:hypothetical protein QVD17_00101 [Tagetes erecta]
MNVQGMQTNGERTTINPSTVNTCSREENTEEDGAQRRGRNSKGYGEQQREGCNRSWESNDPTLPHPSAFFLPSSHPYNTHKTSGHNQ